ncbi:hypothetical protein [Streptomyces sp. NPDC056987]|uniref:hypothetical protein n=1 Tax=Streptomyces sp. NPDC056987 TaxID=3345988 RepID=UPI0036270D29
MMSDVLYLARRDAYAAFLTAADAESHVAWHRAEGRYADDAEAVAAVDLAYAATRAAFNLIDVEGVGPVKEARAVLARLAVLSSDGNPNPEWKDFKAARESFVQAASAYLRGGQRGRG